MTSFLNKLFDRASPQIALPSATHNADLPSIIIKIPVSKWKRAYSWGDTHMAILLKKQLESIGHRVMIQVASKWYSKANTSYDAVIVLRGLRPYKVNPKQINIMWNISHPDDVTSKEYDAYDHVYIASEFWAKKASDGASVPIETMLQCTDPERFKTIGDTKNQEFHHQLLFVGNSRGIFRKIVNDLLPTDYDLAVYGQQWGGFIPSTYIKGEYIDNDILYKYYASADILLNDHWDDMRDKGFVSNRIFDGLACGAFIITDKVRDMQELENYVQVYETKAELYEAIEYYLSHPEERLKKAKEGMEYVLANHTFKKRASQFSSCIINHYSQRT